MKQLIGNQILNEEVIAASSSDSSASERDANTQFVSYHRISETDHPEASPYPAPNWTLRFCANLASSASDALGEAQRANNAQDNEVARIIMDAYESWLSHRMEYDLPVSTANEAIVAVDLLILRDFTHIRALDLRTGAERWRFACNCSLANAASETLAERERSSGEVSLDFHSRFTGNSVFGRLATDGRRVFAIDSSTSQNPCPNQLIALSTNPDPAYQPKSKPSTQTVAPLWIRGGHSGSVPDDLANHVLLGCPLSVDERLYVMGEQDRQINLFSLEAATGHTIWKQAIALADKPILEDNLRLRTACIPLYHNGIVCCPTEVGIVVGVDALTGRLEWVYDHKDEEQRGNSGRWAFNGGSHTDCSLLPNHAFINQGRLLYLPLRSRHVHCLDATRGGLVWKCPRNDGLAIGGVTPSSVIILGGRECRALRMTDGHELWQTSTPEPAGTGAVTGDQYLLPTSNGPCLSIDLKDGSTDSQRFHRLLHRLVGGEYAPTGNLLVHQNRIIATTPLEVRVYDQANHRLERLNAAAKRYPLSPPERLVHAQLLMTLGERDSSEDVLKNLVEDNLNEDVARPAELLLQEVLYAQLEETDDPMSILDRISHLSRTDNDRTRLQLSRLDVSLRLDDSEMFIDTLETLQSPSNNSLISIDGNDEYVVSADQYFRERLASLIDDDHPLLSKAVSSYLQRQIQQHSQFANDPRLERLVSLFADWPQSEQLRFMLARRWMDNHRIQEAELLLLSGPSDSPSRLFPQSELLLSRLYRDQNMLSEAEQVMTPTTPDLRDVAKLGSRASALPRDQTSLPTSVSSTVKPAHGVALSASSITPPIPHAYEIVEHRCIGTCSHGDECECRRARDLYEGIRRSFTPRLTGSFGVLDASVIKTKRTHSRLILVDRNTGQSRGELEVPSPYWALPQSINNRTGQMMVIGGESAHGLSLLERKALWSVESMRSARKNEKILVGPHGSDFCVLQTSRELRVVHPATGRTLWKRTHLPPGIGLLEHETVGIIGDSRTLCVFDDDLTSYTLYHTQSGRSIRQGTRDLPRGTRSRNRWATGRHLVEIVTDEAGDRLSVWNSHDDRLAFNLPLINRLAAPLPGGNDFAFVARDGRLRILNVANERLLLDVPLSIKVDHPDGTPTDTLLSGITKMTAFSDRDRFYVSLANESAVTESTVTAVTDQTEVPHVRVHGRLLAFDQATGEQLWDRTIEDSCIPIRPDAAPKVMLLLSRNLDGQGGNRRQSNQRSDSMMAEVLDTRTGVTAVRRERLLLSRLVQYHYESIDRHQPDGDGSDTLSTTERHSSEVVASLIGLDSRIDIHAHPQTTAPAIRLATEDPLMINH
ncbi:MAG: PQQ-binding-like beta-propeller repeat protein [Planctomycetaceae bacterium]|nr:PQQ-binding-like beta-propeller repeat protein [Planctomycetaceae bacterium]